MLHGKICVIKFRNFLFNDPVLKNDQKCRFLAFFDFSNEEQNVNKGAGGGKKVNKGAFMRHVFGDISSSMIDDVSYLIFINSHFMNNDASHFRIDE